MKEYIKYCVPSIDLKTNGQRLEIEVRGTI